MPHTLIGLGEALFDVFDSGPRLGGAPLNVAAHAHQLLAPAGGRAFPVSRVGQDALGDRLVREVADRGMTTDGLQRDPDKPTGRVTIERTADGGHRFHILPDQAYDWLQADPDLLRLMRDADAVAFGCLAQRNGQARQTIHRLLREARDGGARLCFDVNLRSSDGRDFYDAAILRHGCEVAHDLKLNDEELAVVNRLTRTRDADDLLRTFDLDTLIFTRGAAGTAAYTRDGLVEGESATVAEDRKHPDADTVGAGDSCTAAWLVARLQNRPIPECLTLANRLAAFVAHQAGAVPDLPDDLVAAFG